MSTRPKTSIAQSVGSAAKVIEPLSESLVLRFPTRHALATFGCLAWIERMHDAELSARVEATHMHDRRHAVYAAAIGIGRHVAVGTLLEENLSLDRAPIRRIGWLKDNTIKGLLVGFPNQTAPLEIVEQ